MHSAARHIEPSISTIKISRSKLQKLHSDAVKSAKAVHLIYISDTEAGIQRVREKDGFSYIKNGKPLTDEADMLRIKKLVIPPAWERVWISPIADSHLQATGFDVRGRKQYKYHSLWNTLRNQTKFSHLLEFGKALPAIRKQLQKHLSLQGLPQEKVLAAVISVMQCTCIRIGSNEYEKLYGSFGLTTLKDKHVQIKGSSVQFSFKGKKGVYHNIGMKSRRLAKIVQQCRDIPGKELFQYYNEAGERRAIDSGLVNAYIKQISDGDFTAKDFRTWAGSLKALEVLKEMEKPKSETQAKRKIVEVLDAVATQLGNTRTVCKKYYVHPVILEHYTNGTLAKFLLNNKEDCAEETGLTMEEKLLMKILTANSAALIA